MMVYLGVGFPSVLDSLGVSCVDQYRLDELPVDTRLLLIGMGADQVQLERNRERIDALLARGATLVVCGHIVRDIASGIPHWYRAARDDQDSLRILPVHPHSVWEGVDLDDVTWRKGVAGFYGRGGYPVLPSGAYVVNRVADTPVDVELPLGGGRVLLHGGNDLWGYVREGNTAERIVPQLLAWGMETATVTGAGTGTGAATGTGAGTGTELRTGAAREQIA